jgi:hypothetical protein
MASENLLKSSTTYLFQSASYVPTGNNILHATPDFTPALTLTGLAVGAARQSVKINLGATRPSAFVLDGAFEWFVAVLAGGAIDCYWSASSHATAGLGNQGNTTGLDAAYTGDGGGTVDESVKQLSYIGSFITTDLSAAANVQKGIVNIPGFPLMMTRQYGSLVVVNNSSAILAGTDDIETGILMSGLLVEGQ